jgi:hypothetical protein
MFSKNLCLSLALLRSVDGARIAIETADDHQTQWGRSCASLERRFQHQQTRLTQSEGSRALVQSVSLMRTLRRANARQCEVDTSAAAELAMTYFRQSPCWDAAYAVGSAAQELPAQERAQAEEQAWEILLSDEEGCAAPSLGEIPALTETEEELEEEMDDASDDFMEGATAEPTEASLMQEDQNPLGLAAWYSVFGYWAAGITGGWPLIIASVLFGVLMGLVCGFLVHMMVRIFRYIRCKISGNSCAEYQPATWLRALITAGCGLGGVAYGPFGLAFSYEAVREVGTAVAGAVR